MPAAPEVSAGEHDAPDGAVVAGKAVLAAAQDAPTRFVQPSMAALRLALRRSRADLVPRRRQDGIREIAVRDGWNSASVLVQRPDGQRVQRCVDSPEQLEQLLGAQP